MHSYMLLWASETSPADGGPARKRPRASRSPVDAKRRRVDEDDVVVDVDDASRERGCEPATPRLLEGSEMILSMAALSGDANLQVSSNNHNLNLIFVNFIN